jgi:nucleoside-diphosphate-sugar epimerase
MNVLVVGGTGLISTGTTRQLVDRDYSVTVFNRGETEAAIPDDVDRVEGDRDDQSDLERAITESDADCVIDMVCFTPEQARAAVDAAADRVEQYVFCSTVDVYHRPLRTNPVAEDAGERSSPSPRSTFSHEDAPREPAVSEYGRDKAAAEDVFLAADDRGDFAATVVRPWSTYGEGGPVLHTFGVGTYYVDRIRKGKPVVVHGDGTSLWGPCHRDDVARAFVNAVGNRDAYGEAYHVTSEEVISWNQYHETVARALDAPEPDLVHVPTDVLVEMAPDRTDMLVDHFQFSTVFDNAKARRDLDFEYTVSFEEGGRRTVDWLDENDEIASWDAENDDAIVEAWRDATDNAVERVTER